MTTLDMGYIAEVARKAKEGDANAFAELYAATCDHQYAFACDMLGDELRAQEVLQEVYITALRDISKLREPSMAVTWVNRVNWEHCMKAMGQKPAGEVTVRGGAYPMAAILALPLSEGQAILLKHIRRMRTKNIAACLEITPKDVRAYVRSGLRRLRRAGGGAR